MDQEESTKDSNAPDVEEFYIFAKKTAENLVSLVGVDAEVETRFGADGAIVVIKTKDAGVLIGEGGQHLQALNHIIKKICEKSFPDFYHSALFTIDVNDYQRKRIEQLRDLARMSAQRVRYFKKEVHLEPMSSYDRRIIHMTLAEHPDIETESAGEPPARCVVIKPR